MKIVFLHRSLEVGGAERQLIVVANGLAERGHDVTLVLFYATGALLNKLHQNVKLRTLRKGGRHDFIFYTRLFRLFREEKPEVLCSLLPAQNLALALYKFWHPRQPVVGGIRVARLDLTQYDWVTRLAYRLEPFAARYADLVISNSQAGMVDAVARGFPRQKLTVVQNAIDTEHFRPRPEARPEHRAAWGIGSNEIVVATAGRLDPQKDHRTFLIAASEVAKRHDNVRFLCVGPDGLIKQGELRSFAADLGLHDRVIWLGGSSTMPAILGACDIFCLSSRYEGFPNVLAEAMSCQLPCISTDVGDAAQILGGAGLIVPPGDATALTSAMLELIEASPGDREKMGVDARERILKYFTASPSVDAFEKALETVANRKAPEMARCAPVDN